MEKGLILALFAALSFAFGSVFLRRAVYQTGESFTGTVISVFTGVPFFAVSVFISGDWYTLGSVSGRAVILLAVAGISHFVLGRILSYASIRLIGANRGSAISQTQMLYAVILGILILHESLTAFLVLGVLCIAGGVTLVTTQRGKETTRVRGSGIMAGFGGAFFWGISGVLTKPALTELGSPEAAAFVSFVAAALVSAGLLAGKRQRGQMSRLTARSLINLIAAGMFGALAQLFRFTAIDFSPVSVVIPLIATSTIFVFFLSFLFNRKIEIFTWRVFSGIVFTVLGVFVLFL